MAVKSRAKYEVYLRWYDKYAEKGEMWQEPLTKGAYMAQWRDAHRAGKDMKDFSRTIARRQRVASDIQFHATWGGTKKALKEFRKQIGEKRKQFINDALEEHIRRTKGNLTDAEMSRQIQRIRKKGIPEYVKIGAETRLRNFYANERDAVLESFDLEKREAMENMLSKYELVEDYKGMTYRDFKMENRQIVNSARELTILDDEDKGRELWDEAFRIAFDSPKEKSA